MERISRGQAFMEIAETFAKRSTCNRGHVGCVAVVNDHIVAAGFNGAPSGHAHCLDVGCGGGVVVREAQLDPLPGGEMPRPAEQQPVIEFPNGCTRAIHGEANMVGFAAKVGASLEGCTVYSTAAPCLPCAQLLIAAGMRTLVYLEAYRLPQGLQLVEDMGITVARYGDMVNAK